MKLGEYEKLAHWWQFAVFVLVAGGVGGSTLGALAGLLLASILGPQSVTLSAPLGAYIGSVAGIMIALERALRKRLQSLQAYIDVDEAKARASMRKKPVADSDKAEVCLRAVAAIVGAAGAPDQIGRTHV